MPASFGPSRFPISLDEQAKIVFLPRAGDVRVDRARLAVPQWLRLAVVATGAENGLEAVQLAAWAEYVLHAGKAGNGEDDAPADARQAAVCSLMDRNKSSRRDGKCRR